MPFQEILESPNADVYCWGMICWKQIRYKHAQTATFPPAGTCLWFLPNISLGIPGVSRTVKNFMALNFKCRGKEWKKTYSPILVGFFTSCSGQTWGKHTVPYPFNIQENGQNISNFYRCMGLTADSIINHRNLAKVCKSMKKCPRFFSDCKNNTY